MQKIYYLLIMSAFCFACGESTSAQEREGNQGHNAVTETGNSGKEKDYSVSEADKMQAASNFLIPSPGEILTALDKLEEVEWGTLASYNKNVSYDNKYARALNLGVRVADAFVAINDEDREHFGDMSGAIFDLGRELGIGQILQEKREQLDELAAQEAWRKMAAAVDNVHNDIETEVQELGEDELVVLASVAGWLEGLKVVSGHLQDNYAADKTELLNQAGLIAYYHNEIKMLPPHTRDNALVSALTQSLASISNVLGPEESPEFSLSLDQVKELHQLSQDIINKIELG